MGSTFAWASNRAVRHQRGGFVEEQPIFAFKSYIAGKNADVAVYADRIEWIIQNKVSKGKVALGVMTYGISLAKTGVRSSVAAGSEMIPIRSITSVTTVKDGMSFTKVRVIASGNAIDFRVPHADAPVIADTIKRLILEGHSTPAVNVQVPVGAADAAGAGGGGDIMAQLRQLGELRDAGVLSESEFEAKKAELLGRL